MGEPSSFSPLVFGSAPTPFSGLLESGFRQRGSRAEERGAGNRRGDPGLGPELREGDAMGVGGLEGEDPRGSRCVKCPG